MKTHALIAILVLASVPLTHAIASSKAEEVAVKTVVDQFAQAWETEDMTLFSRVMAHDADMVNFGTDAAEHFVGWEALRDAAGKMFPAFEKTKLTVKEQVIKIHSSGNAAWFSELVDWDLLVEGKPVHQSCRFTGVLEKRKGKWIIVQFHNSVPVS